MTLEQVEIGTRTQWRSWLADHHDISPGIWLVRWKKNSGRPHLSYDDLVEEALCFGWVDSQPRRLDEQRSQLRVGPRKAGSSWSAANKTRIQHLTDAGLMQPAGIAAVERARNDGTWTALDDVERLVEPDDLADLLESDRTAKAQWQGFPPSTRRAILEWLGTAKTDTTRQRRLHRIVSDASQGIRANQWRQPNK